MFIFRSSVLLFACAAVSFGAPQFSQRSKKAFTIPQSDPKPFIIAGPSALDGIYRKYNKIAPPEVKAAAQNNDGTIEASPQDFDSQYLCPVEIGGQTFDLGFDTGSSDL